jgi:hypothetical protein
VSPTRQEPPSPGPSVSSQWAAAPISPFRLLGGRPVGNRPVAPGPVTRHSAAVAFMAGPPLP